MKRLEGFIRGLKHYRLYLEKERFENEGDYRDLMRVLKIGGWDVIGTDYNPADGKVCLLTQSTRLYPKSPVPWHPSILRLEPFG